MQTRSGDRQQELNEMYKYEIVNIIDIGTENSENELLWKTQRHCAK